MNILAITGLGFVCLLPTMTQATCNLTATPISEIQGEGASSPFRGREIEIEAVVTGVFQQDDQLAGFFVEEEAEDRDQNRMTSEGLFVFSTHKVRSGDQVRIRGTVVEYFGLTEISKVTQLMTCSEGYELPKPIELKLPFNSLQQLEALEGMRVQIDAGLQIADTYNLHRFGEFSVSLGRLFQATELFPIGSEALQHQAQNHLRLLTIGDGSRRQYPKSISLLNLQNRQRTGVRLGDTLGKLEGILNYSFGAYKLIPTLPMTLSTQQPRPAQPPRSQTSDLRVVGFNVQNAFNGDGRGGGFPSERGATTLADWLVQRDKLVSTMQALDADVLGLSEIENDAADPSSALAELVRQLNIDTPNRDQYDFLKPQPAGVDVIRVALIYRPSVLQPVGEAHWLDANTSAQDEAGLPLYDDKKNRPTLVQVFKHLPSGKQLTLTVSHLKSKGSSCDASGDPNLDDGQGNCNQTRVRAVQALLAHLASSAEVDAGVIAIGDFNAYRMEAPMNLFREQNWVLSSDHGDYSYAYQGLLGHLDHIVVSPALADDLLGFQTWHINADELQILDYTSVHKDDALLRYRYQSGYYRSSDHDPVIADWRLSPE